MILLVMLMLFAAQLMAAEESEYRTLDWVELLPDADYQALMNPPDWLADVADGSEADTLDGFDLRENESDFMRALSSSVVRPELNGQKIRIPGFIVPLEVNENRDVTEFLLVPYFGACLHLPPPPPNQVVHVRYEQGLDSTDIYLPYWIEGDLSLESISTWAADSAYAMKAINIVRYTE